MRCVLARAHPSERLYYALDTGIWVLFHWSPNYLLKYKHYGEERYSLVGQIHSLEDPGSITAD